MLTQYQSIRKAQQEQNHIIEVHSVSQEENNNCPNFNALKEIGYYTLSNTIAPGIEIASHFVNIIILANKTLPASALIGSYQLLNTTTGCVMLSTTCTIVSNAFGEKEHDPTQAHAKIRHSLKGGIIFALILSVPAVISSLCSQEVLKLCRQPEELLSSVEEYFVAYSWGIPAIFLVYLEKQIALGVSDIKSVNTLTLLDSVSTSLLGYLFVNGKWGGKEMGVAGLGFASSITNWLELIFYSIYLKYSSCYQDYKFDLFSELKEVKNTLKELLFLGVPCGIQAGSEFLFLLGYSALVGNLGINALSAYQISSQYILLAGVLTSGLNQSAIFLVGRESGANRITHAKKIGTFCIIFGGGISLVLCGFMSAISKELISSLIDIENPENDEIVMNARILFIIKGIMQSFDSIRIITGGAIQGAFKETKTAMILGLINLGLIGLSLAYVLGFPAKLGLIGVAIAQGIGVSLGGSFLLGHWFKKIKNWVSPLLMFRDESSSAEHLRLVGFSASESPSIDVFEEVSLEHMPHVEITQTKTLSKELIEQKIGTISSAGTILSRHSDEISLPFSSNEDGEAASSLSLIHDVNDHSASLLVTPSYKSYKSINNHLETKDPSLKSMDKSTQQPQQKYVRFNK